MVSNNSYKKTNNKGKYGIKTFYCIRGSHSCGHKQFNLLGYKASFVYWLLSAGFLLDLPFDPEGAGKMFI
jgi:hypothetical protein